MRSRRTLVLAIATALLLAPLAVWASDRFEDVPDENVFHDDISWLADSGVTFGCNPPENTRFCPDENVTREQMAAFMRRLSEGQVVDAAKLEGQPGAVYLTTVGYDSCGFDANFATDCVEIPGDTTTLLTATVDAPVPGLVRLGSHWYINDQSVNVWFSEGANCNVSQMQQQVANTGGQLGFPDINSLGGHVEVGAGTTTVHLCAFTPNTVTPLQADLNVEFSPNPSTNVSATSSESNPVDLPIDLDQG